MLRCACNFASTFSFGGAFNLSVYWEKFEAGRSCERKLRKSGKSSLSSNGKSFFRWVRLEAGLESVEAWNSVALDTIRVGVRKSEFFESFLKITAAMDFEENQSDWTENENLGVSWIGLRREVNRKTKTNWNTSTAKRRRKREGKSVKVNEERREQTLGDWLRRRMILAGISVVRGVQLWVVRTRN